MCILTCAHREARHGCTRTRTIPPLPPLRVHLHELYETPTRYTRCAYFNDLINCRHGQYVQWPSPLHPLSIFAPLAKNHRATVFARLFSSLPLFSFPFLSFPFFLYARHWKLVYWVIRGIINTALKNTRFFLFRRCYLRFLSFLKLRGSWKIITFFFLLKSWKIHRVINK